MPHGSAFAFGCGLLVFGGAGLGGGPDFLGGNSGVDSLKFDLELNGSLRSCGASGWLAKTDQVQLKSGSTEANQFGDT